MKALSLRQPWAWLVVHAGKTIENRRWNTRFRGTFLIHAAKGMTFDEYAAAVAFAHATNAGIIVPKPELLERGGIIGRARLVSVIEPCPAVPEEFVFARCEHPWHIPDQFGFMLADVEAVPYVKLGGALSFFDVPEHLAHGTIGGSP